VGKVDVLINNAGTVFGETLLELSDTAIETTYKVNILSHYWAHGHTTIHATLVCPYYINTGMFDGVTPRLMPMLEPEYVAETMIDSIRKNEPTPSKNVLGPDAPRHERTAIYDGIQGKTQSSRQLTSLNRDIEYR
ncbi:hypothetical protein MSG28_013277, partial [Choristoneura fumiferana]